MPNLNDGKHKKAQKHKNKTAFKIVFDTKALQHNTKKVSLQYLCQRCVDQINWKLTYNKYKKMTEPSRCNICSEKNVYRTYMKACQKCTQQKNICSKCCTPDYQKPQGVKIPLKVQKQKQRIEYQNQIEFMKSLKQRSRRTVRRNLQKGLIRWDNNQEYFVDEEGEKMIGLHFRKGLAGLDDDQDDFDDGLGDDDDFDDDEDNDKQVGQSISNQQDEDEDQMQF